MMKTIIKQRFKITTLLIGLVLSLFFLAHCGKDKTLSDYHQKKVDEAMVQLQSVAGVYRGTIKDSRDNSDIGDLEIELTPKAAPVNSDDNTTTAAQAFLQGKISLFNKSESNVVIQKANYFWGDTVSSTNFNGTIAIPLTDGSTASMTITGRIAGDQFNGELSPDNKFGIKGNFKLSKNAQFAKPHQKNEAAPNIVAEYKGTYKDPFCDFTLDNRTKDNIGSDKCLEIVEMNIQNVTNNLGENFLNNFFLERNVSVYLSFNRMDATHINGVSFQKAVIDLQNGTIIAQGTYSGAINTVINLNCNSITSPDKGKGWACTYISQFNGRKQPFNVYSSLY